MMDLEIDLAILRQFLHCVFALHLLVTMVAAGFPPTATIDKVHSSWDQITVSTVMADQTHIDSVRYDHPSSDWKRLRFWKFSPTMEMVYLWFVGVGPIFYYTHVEPVISVKGFPTLHDGQDPPNHFGEGIECKTRRIYWSVTMGSRNIKVTKKQSVREGKDTKRYK